MQSFPKPMTAQEELECISRYRAGDIEAKNLLIEKNLRLVAHIVKKYTVSGRDQEELISVGIVGLVKAVNTFDADKGHKLVTYAARCIENEILMLLRSERRQGRKYRCMIRSALTRKAMKSTFWTLLKAKKRILWSVWPLQAMSKDVPSDR